MGRVPLMVLCVAGPMAAGKNAAASILEELGFVSVDADLVGHRAVDACRDEILSAFSAFAEQKKIQLLDADGKIIRRNLGAIVFEKKELVRKQEDIVFPYINAELEKFLDENAGKNVVLNAAVLYKIPVMKRADAVFFIDSPALVRFVRSKKRDGMKTCQILGRFLAQRTMFREYKKTGIKVFRINNLGSLDSLRKKIQAVLSCCF
ncbi:dephospho-CoA kinase [Treponema sp.]|uniref:dephospho-CoA kinase n=1 Tax=Treponema sp. TaxID=166 RepID=UPI003F0C0E86